MLYFHCHPVLGTSCCATPCSVSEHALDSFHRVPIQVNWPPPSSGKNTVPGRNEAIYFSRLNVPYRAEKAYIHHGIYVFRGSTLFDLQTIHPLHNVSESLEQLRWIENQMLIQCHIINAFKSGIDVDEDFDKFQQN